MQVISILYGYQSFKKSSAKVYVFAMKCNNSFDRVLLHTRGSTVGKPTRLMASKRNLSISGFWSQSRIDVEENIIVSIGSAISKYGRVFAEGVLLLLLRKDAPLISISVDLGEKNKDARFKKVEVFTGRADVLGINEASDFNIKYPKAFITKYFNREEIDEIYTVKILQEGTKKPKMVDVPVGGGRIRKVAVSDKPRKRIRIVKYSL